RVHHMGIDCRRFRFDTSRRVDESPLRILCEGRMVEKKGFDIASRAFAALRKFETPVELHFVGDGPGMAKLVQLSKEIGTDSTVVFHGWVNQETLLDIQRASHIFL